MLLLSPMLPKNPYAVIDVGSDEDVGIVKFAIVCPAPLNAPLNGFV